jgi:hypothetical protein
VAWVVLLILGTASGAGVWWARHTSALSKTPHPEAVDAAAVTDRLALSIPEAEREFLWALEHHGNLLNKFGFRRLGAALAEDEDESLRAMLAPDFEARLFAESREARVDGGAFAAERRERGGEGDRRLSATEFVDWLLALRSRFSPPPKFEFGISALSPVSRDDLDGPWRGTCKMRLWGFAGEASPAETVVVMKFQVVRPDEKRLKKPAWFLACSIEQVGAADAKEFLFRDTATARGLEPSRFYDNWKEEEKFGHTGGVYACDYNRDGCVDLLVTDRNQPWVFFYQGSADGTFRDVTREAGLLSESGEPPKGVRADADTCAFIDFDNDGWEDLIFLGGSLYRNIDGQRFEPWTHRTNLFDVIYGAYRNHMDPGAILPADYDGDGLIDLYVVRAGKLRNPEAGWIDEEPLREAGNQLLRNRGNGRFEDVTRRTGTAGGGRSVFTAAWLDANNDNRPDVYVINEFGKGLLLVNETNGPFREVELVDGVADWGSMGLAAGDFDNDGNIDVYAANMYSKAGNRVVGSLAPGLYSDEVMAKLRRLVQGSRLYRNQGHLQFTEVGRSFQVHDVGWAWGTAMADFNNDGWLDIYATAGYMSRDRAKPDG